MIERQRLVDDLVRDEGIRRYGYDPKAIVAMRESLWASQIKSVATRLMAQKQTGSTPVSVRSRAVLCVS